MIGIAIVATGLIGAALILRYAFKDVDARTVGRPYSGRSVPGVPESAGISYTLDGRKVLAIVDCHARSWQLIGLRYFDADKRPYELTGGSEIQLVSAPIGTEPSVPVRCVLVERSEESDEQG